jgi:hypothetical protein
MANLDFFAARDDLIALLDFIFAETDFRVYDRFGLYDSEITEFRTRDEVLARHPNLGVLPFPDDSSIRLILISPTICPPLLTAKDPTWIADWGKVTLDCAGAYGQFVLPSAYFHFTEGRSRREGYEPVSTSIVDWTALKVTSGKIERIIRRVRAKGRAWTHPVLDGAYKLHEDGYTLVYQGRESEPLPVEPLRPRNGS